MSQPLRVSIVTPCLNAAQHLEAAIQSVLTQDYAPIEYLVMDGGSTDSTREILRRYESRLRWTSGRDKGQADAINRGFAQTGGDVLGWLNADDVYAPGAVRASVQYLEDHPDVALVYGDAEFIDAGGRRIARCAHVEPFDRHRLLHYSDYIVQPAAFFRRYAFDAVGGLDASLHWAMDYDLWLKLAARFGVAYLPRVLAQYRWLSDAKTARGGFARLDEVDRVASRHGAKQPAYFCLERVNLHLQDARRSIAHRQCGTGIRSLSRAAGTLLRSRRAMGSLLSSRTWRVIRTGQVLRARAAAESHAPNPKSAIHNPKSP